MFCSKCGATLPDNATVCPACNAAVPGATSSTMHSGAAATGAAAAMNAVRGSGLQALSALKMIVRNPVGELPQAYETLGDGGALRVGIVFGVLSVICFLLGGYFMVRSVFGGSIFDLLGFGGFMKLVLFAFCPFVGLALCSLAVRKGFGKGGGLGGDCFMVGTALLPTSIWALISPIFGAENYSIVGGLMIVALCIGVLILFSGYVRITKVDERWATYAVPVAIILTMWLSNAIARSLMSPSGSSRTYRPSESEMRDFQRFDFGR